MAQNVSWRVVMISVCWLSAVSFAGAASEVEQSHPQLLAGENVLLGIVEEIRGDQARINTNKGQPRFIPMGVRKAKGLPDLKKGDVVEVTVNDQNLLVDVHLPGEASIHRVVVGQLAGPMETGHDKAVIRTTDGKEELHAVRPVARSKVASIPIGADAIFLIDELDKVVDVTMNSAESVHRAADLRQQKSPLKGNLEQVAGVVVEPLQDNVIVIRTNEGKEQSYEVRALIQQRLGTLAKGATVVLLVDEADKVTDAAFVPQR